ncbi:MAG: hypothetical protein CL840_08750 [Crocinitomicaceae bacterium]|nr:hypothetical protein [Crocinitomicaceae bacterium]|tara:strand:- start:48356 stop:48607 length:252 start_codon:yes stop_codon:yes gene_type:complete
MSTGLDKSTNLKLWVIFSLFIGLIISLIVLQINNFINAKEQRENIESLRRAQTKFLNSTAAEHFGKDSTLVEPGPKEQGSTTD